MADFTSILSKKATEIEKPKPRPIGTYLANLVGLPKQRTVNTKDGERSILAFSAKLIAPQADVDAEQLANHGDVAIWPQFSRDIWIDTPEGEWELRKFLTDVLGITPGDKSLGEMAAESAGKQLLVTLKHEPFVNRNTGEAEIATRIGAVAAV